MGNQFGVVSQSSGLCKYDVGYSDKNEDDYSNVIHVISQLFEVDRPALIGDERFKGSYLY